MSKASYNAVMRELKAIKRQMDKDAKKAQFKAMKEAAKNERAVQNLAKNRKPFDLYISDDKFDPSIELGVGPAIGFSDTY